jgi:alcohol dehydrogenase class IV
MDGLQRFVFDEPTKIIYGSGALSELKTELWLLGAKSVLLICDQGIVKAGLVDKVKAIFKDLPDLQLWIYDSIITNPYDTTMDAAYEYAKEKQADTILGLGGGSSLDAAKGVALLLTNGGKLHDYLMDGQSITKPIAPTILIPTTAGTGSEVTRTIVATDQESGFKDGFKDAATIYAKTAIIDPELMSGLPPQVLAACGMDALTHAIEAYTSWKANPITDALNLQAIKIIGQNLRTAYAQPANMDAKGMMLLASAMTGIAFDQSGLGLAHCMGHPMGGLFNVPHGVACAMALPVVMEYNLIANPKKFADIALLLGEEVRYINQMAAAKAAVAGVRALLVDLELPTKLGDVGISGKDISKLAKDAMGFPGMRGANPRFADERSVAELFRKLL